MRILLIGGGWSNEREVSLKGSEAIKKALRELGHEVDFFDPALELANLLKRALKCDFAFINLHGSPGEDGSIQALLEQVGCPYQGAGPKGSQLALNKAAAKILFEHSGIPTPKWELVTGPPQEDWSPGLVFPLFIKPNDGGSSLDVIRIDSGEELAEPLHRLISKGKDVLLEERIHGQEITCAVLGEQALPPILIQPAGHSAFFDYFSKYTPKAATEICPAPIEDELSEQIKKQALTVHNILDLKGYSRTDFIVQDNKADALEVNTLPGMTATSLLPQAAQAVGFSFAELLSELIDLGLQNK